MPFSIISVEPREPVMGQTVKVKISVRSDYALPHPFFIKVIAKDGRELGYKNLGILQPNEVKNDVVEFKAELLEGHQTVEVDLWVQVEAINLLDDFKEIGLNVRKRRRLIEWLLRR